MTVGHQPGLVGLQFAPPKELALTLPKRQWHNVTWREGSNARLTSRFAAVRVRPAHRGIHNTGAPLFWELYSLEDVPCGNLVAVTEEQITDLFRALAPLIGADSEDADKPATAEQDVSYEPLPPFADVLVALNCIPNDGPPNWKHWNNVGMAVWHCTNGSEMGFLAWVAWSAKNHCHERKNTCRERWDNYHKYPPTRTGYGKLAAMASEANGGFISPSFVASQSQPVVGPTLTPPLPANERLVPDEIMEVEGVLRQFVDWCVATAPSPQPFLALGAGICLIGTVAGRKYRTPTNLRTNIYGLGIADSGGGKDHPRVCIKEALTEARLEQYLGGEALASGQGMLSALQIHPAILYLLDEFGKDLQNYLAPNPPPYLRAIWTNLTRLFTTAGTSFLGTDYKDTKREPRVRIRQPCLSVFATSVPGPVWEALKRISLHDGSIARFLLFVSPEDYPEWNHHPAPLVVPEPLIEGLQAIVRGAEGHCYGGNLAHLMVADGGLNAYTPSMTPEAAALLEQLLKEQRRIQREAEPGSMHRVIWARRWEHASKLTLIRAISRCPGRPEITELDVRWARLLVEHCQATFLRDADRFIANSAVELDKKELIEIVRRFGPISQNELTRRTQRFNARYRKDLLDDLVTGGALVKQMASTSLRGPKAVVYSVSQT